MSLIMAASLYLCGIHKTCGESFAGLPTLWITYTSLVFSNCDSGSGDHRYSGGYGYSRRGNTRACLRFPVGYAQHRRLDFVLSHQHGVYMRWGWPSYIYRMKPGEVRASSDNLPKRTWLDGTKQGGLLLSSLLKRFNLGLINVATHFFLTVPVSRLFHSPTRFCRVGRCLVDHAPNRGRRHHHPD